MIAIDYYVRHTAPPKLKLNFNLKLYFNLEI